MKKLLTTTLAIMAVLVVSGFFAPTTYAETARLEVQFEQKPLFNEASFAPGETISRFVKVKNNTSITQKVVAETINENNQDDLAKEFNLAIKEHDAETNLWNGTLAEFFTAGETYLSDLPANTEKQYDFSATFDPNAGNDYKGKKLGFDFLIGFQGQEGDGVKTQDIPVSGGGGGGYSGLLISNEAVENAIVQTENTAQVIINWQTNYSSTSQVIYGVYTGTPYTLNLLAENFGYPDATVEDLNKVLNHSVTINGLVPGNTYSYRVVSHASPATISYEHTFTVPFKSSVLQEKIDLTENIIEFPESNMTGGNVLARNNAILINEINNNVEEAAAGPISESENAVEKPNLLAQAANGVQSLTASAISVIGKNIYYFMGGMLIVLGGGFGATFISRKKRKRKSE